MISTKMYKNTPKLYWIILCYLLGSYSLLAQKSTRYERLTTASGLSQNTINKIIQDKKGFLWFEPSKGFGDF